MIHTLSFFCELREFPNTAPLLIPLDLLLAWEQRHSVFNRTLQLDFFAFMCESVAFTRYNPVIVQRLPEAPLPTLGEAIAAKARALGVGLVVDDAVFDVDAAPRATDWWEIDLLAKVQPSAGDFLRSLPGSSTSGATALGGKE